MGLGAFLSLRKKKPKLWERKLLSLSSGPGKELPWAKLKLNKRELWGGRVDKFHKCQDCPNLCLNLLSFHFTPFISYQINPQGFNYYLTYVPNSFPGCNPAFPTAHQMSKLRYAIISSTQHSQTKLLNFCFKPVMTPDFPIFVKQTTTSPCLNTQCSVRLI